MIQIQAWQVDFHPGKLDLGLLIWMDKLKGILKLHCTGLYFSYLVFKMFMIMFTICTVSAITTPPKPSQSWTNIREMRAKLIPPEFDAFIVPANCLPQNRHCYSSSKDNK